MQIYLIIYCETNTAQKMKFSKLRISPHLKKKFFLCSEIVQPVTKYFEIFVPFLLSFPRSSLLSSKTECISCFTSCWTILKNTEISENLKVAWRQSLVPSLLSRNKCLAMVLENWKKIIIKSSIDIDKAYFTHFRKLVSNILRGLHLRKKPTCKRHSSKKLAHVSTQKQASEVF